jgi:hypothetical protein
MLLMSCQVIQMKIEFIGYEGFTIAELEADNVNELIREFEKLMDSSVNLHYDHLDVSGDLDEC